MTVWRPRQLTLGMKIYEGQDQEPDTLFYHRQTSDKKRGHANTVFNRLKAFAGNQRPKPANTGTCYPLLVCGTTPTLTPAYLEQYGATGGSPQPHGVQKDMYADLGTKWHHPQRAEALPSGSTVPCPKNSTALVMTRHQNRGAKPHRLVGKTRHRRRMNPSVRSQRCCGLGFKKFSVVKMYCDPTIGQTILTAEYGVWGVGQNHIWPATQLDLGVLCAIPRLPASSRIRRGSLTVTKTLFDIGPTVA